MDFGDYLKIDAQNWSTIKHIARSPLHYKHALENPMVDRVIWMRGRCTHTAILEPDRLDVEYVIYPGKTRKGPAWDEFLAEHPGRTILKQHEYDKSLHAAEAVLRHSEVRALMMDGVPEGSIEWTDRDTGLKCKGRVDWNGSAIFDVKTTVDVDARRFGNLAGGLSYQGQLAMYRDGVADGYCDGARPGKQSFIVAVEREPPYDVAVYQLDSDTLFVGQELYRDCLRRVLECRERNEWPGRYPGRQLLQLPRYVYADPEQDDGTVQIDEGGD